MSYWKKAFLSKPTVTEAIVFILGPIFLFIFAHTIYLSGGRDEIADYFHNVNIALFTILIPLAIAVISDYFRDKRTRSEKNYSELDLIVITESVFDIKLVFISIIFSYIPSFLWIGSNTEITIWTIDIWLRGLLIAIWLIGVGIIIKIILDFLKWIYDPYYHRFAYLKKSKINEKYIVAWNSVWKTKENNHHHEERFIEIFSEKIYSLINKGKTDLYFNSLIRSFSSQIKNRNIDTLIWGGVDSLFPPLSLILDWHHKSKTFFENNERGFPFYNDIERALEFLEIKIFGLINKTQRYFRLIKKHLENKSDKYIKSFFEHFLYILFSNIDKISNMKHFWNTYPYEWKITYSNLESKEYVPKISFEESMNWIINKTYRGNSGSYLDINEVLHNLYPRIEPVSWMSIIIFLFDTPRHLTSEERLEEFINIDAIDYPSYRTVTIWNRSPEVIKSKAYKEELEENKKLLKFIDKFYIPSKDKLKEFTELVSHLEKKYKDDNKIIGRINKLSTALKLIEESIK